MSDFKIDAKTRRIIDYYAARFGRRNDTLIEELKQEGAIGAWMSWQTFDPSKSSFATYAWMSVRSRIRNFAYRKDLDLCPGQERPLNLDAEGSREGETFGENLEGDSLTPEALIVRGEAFAELARWLGFLSDCQSEILEAYYFAGYSMLEIGKRRGLSRQRVNIIIKAALDKLRRIAEAASVSSRSLIQDVSL